MTKSEVKSYTRKELIHLYGVSHKTFSKWIDGLGLERKRVFTPKEVGEIFKKLGEP